MNIATAGEGESYNNEISVCRCPGKHVMRRLAAGVPSLATFKQKKLISLKEQTLVSLKEASFTGFTEIQEEFNPSILLRGHPNYTHSAAKTCLPRFICRSAIRFESILINIKVTDSVFEATKRGAIERTRSGTPHITLRATSDSCGPVHTLAPRML